MRRKRSGRFSRDDPSAATYLAGMRRFMVVVAGIGLATFPGMAGGGARQVTAERAYQQLIEEVAQDHELEPNLLTALVEVESGRRADAVSPKGAIGLGQLMPETAARFGVDDPYDPEANLIGSARYLKWLLSRYGGNRRLALAAYNAGEGAVDRYGGIPPYRETRSYVKRVLSRTGRANSGESRPGTGAAKIKLDVSPNGSLVITNQP